MEECISVIVPIYNVAPYLEECIESIINQTYSNLEIILVDDGSTDSSGTICDKYAAMDKRIVVMHKENGGLVTARKAALAVAKGKYVSFVDGDDYIEPDFCEVLYNEIREKDIDFVQCTGIEEGGIGGAVFLPRYVEDQCVVFDRKEVIHRFFRCYFRHEDYISVNIWNKLFVREFIKENYASVPDFQQFGEDFLCICECLLHCRSFASIDKRLYHYRIREDSLSRDLSEKQLAKICDVTILLKIKLLEQDCYFPEVESFLNEWFLGNLYYYMEIVIAERMNIYHFPDIRQLMGKRIVLYGAGNVGRSYYNCLSLYSRIKIVAWADKKAERISCHEMQLITPDSIITKDYDILLIAVENESIAEEIRQGLIEQGVKEEKILWKHPV